jgi:AraC-like DNA-binding protein
MQAVLFNINDVALLLITGECGMLALLFLVHRGAKPIAHILLAIFLILNGLIAVHVVTLWGEVRYRVFDISPNIFFLFTFAYFLEGPVLYWYTKSLLYKSFSFKPADAWHLLPMLVTPLYLYFVYYRHPLEIKRGLALDFRNYGIYEPNFHPFVHAQKTLVVVYGVMCLYELLRYRTTLKDNYSNIEKIDFAWLRLLIGGFLLAWLWMLATHIIGIYMPLAISHMMGTIGTYLIFFLINTLAFYSLVYSSVFEGINAEGWYYKPTEKEAITPEYAEKICTSMEAGKLFLNPRLTLEEFADSVGLSPRLVSSVMNRYIHQSFHEFVNRYRVEEAKQILREQARKELPVTDIVAAAGFNSKATFNRFFKKYAGLTPSQYRQKYSGERRK